MKYHLEYTQQTVSERMKYLKKNREGEKTKDKEDIIMKWYRKPCNPANVPHYTKDQTKPKKHALHHTMPYMTAQQHSDF